MNIHTFSSEIKGKAREILTGKYTGAVLLVLLSQSISFSASFTLNMLTTMFGSMAMMLTGQESLGIGFTILTYCLGLGCSILTGVFHLGSALFFLNIACGQRYSISNLFYGFQYQFKKALIISAALGLVDALCTLPYEVFRRQFIQAYDSSLLPPMVIALVLGMLVYVPVSLALSQSFYLLLDFPQSDGMEVLKHSIQVMKGNKTKLFYIQLSFLPLILLCILSFGIGLLWLTPYMNMTYTYFFLDIMNPGGREEAV